MALPTASMPAKPFLRVAAEPSDLGFVEFTVNTNLPTPLAAMASLDLQSQKPHDSAIGTSHKVTLTGAVTVFRIKAVNDDDGMDDKALPNGLYDAGVIVGPRWDENKAIASLTKIFEAKQTVRLHSGRERATVERQDTLQKWVIHNVPSDAPWNQQKYVAKLGPFKKSASSLSALHDAYYFPEADITLIVNRSRQEVSLWRVGRAER